MSTLPTSLFGRSYRLTVQAQTSPGAPLENIVVSDSAWEPEALRFTFDIEKVALRTFWNSVIRIYNCDGPIPYGPSQGKILSNLIISEGATVTVEAGYLNGSSGVIWQGEIFQPIFTRENVVDFVLTLRCIQGRILGTNNFINNTGTPLQTARAQAEFIAKNAIVPIPYTPQSIDALDNTSLTKDPYPVTVFGDPYDAMYGVAQESGLLCWLSQNGLSMASLTDNIGPVVASYAPAFSPGSTPQTAPSGVSLTLIGTPKQTLLGADWTVLMDPRMDVTVPLSQVQVDLAALELAPLVIGSLPPRPLPQTGTYVVVGVRHTGDTRGNEWLTHVTGITSVSSAIALLGQDGLGDYLSS